jgi:hypothetical protein
MLLLLILAVFGQQASEIPYQHKLTCGEHCYEQSDSEYLTYPYPVFAQSVSGGNHNQTSTDHQPEAANNSQQNYAIRIAIAAVTVNTIYVFVAILQLRAIKYQVRMSHRPQLAAAPEDVDDLFDGSAPRIKIRVNNVGATTAYDCRYETWIEVLPFPFTSFSDHADHVDVINPCALYPNHQPLIINIPIRAGLSDDERLDILNLRRFVCIRVSFTYKDVFRWRRRYANFGFYVENNGLAFLPKYNDAN